MKIYFLPLFAFLFFFNDSLHAQLYFSDNNLEAKIHELYFDNCEEFRSNQDNSTPQQTFKPASFYDIALHPDGRLFAIIPQLRDAEPKNSIILELDIIKYEFKDTLPPRNLGEATGLCIDENGVFYAGSNAIKSYNPRTGLVQNHGYLPAGDFIAGDIIFHNNHLIGSASNFSSIGGNKVYSIDIEDAMRSEILFDFRNTSHYNYGNLGVTSFWVNDSNGEKTKKLVLGGMLALEESQEIYSHVSLFNIENRSYEILCDSLTIRGSRDGISGMTSEDEFRQNPYLRLDLDRNNSSGRMIDHFIVDSVCVTDFPVADEDVRILTDYERIDSLVMWLKEGEQQSGEEWISGTFSDHFEVEGNQTTRLVLRNKGTATIADFETALRNIRYQIVADEVSDGRRELWTLLYKDGVPSDEARTFLDVQANISAYAGKDGSITVCAGGRLTDLRPVLGEHAVAGGRWEPELSGILGDNGVDVPVLRGGVDTAGIYQYIVQAGDCPADTATIEVHTIKSPDFLGNNLNPTVAQVFICEGDTFLWDATIPNGTTYYWSGDEGYLGFGESVRPFTVEGFHGVEIKDENNCNWDGKIYLRYHEGEQIEMEEEVFICKGEAYEWEEQLFFSDTTLVRQVSSETSCDSLITTYVRLVSDVTTYLDYEFCAGEQATLEGVFVNRDTSFCINYDHSNTCDSTVCVEVYFQPLARSVKQDTICEGETYLFNDRTLTQSGWYMDTVALEDCDSLIGLQLLVAPTYQIDTQILIMQGSSILFEGQELSIANAYHFDHQTAAGCDSTITLYLSVQPKPTNVQDISTTDYYAPTLIRSGETAFFIRTKHGVATVATHLRHLKIVNAQGQIVWQEQDRPIGNLLWQPTTSGVYFFQATLVENGRLIDLMGKVVVI